MDRARSSEASPVVLLAWMESAHHEEKYQVVCDVIKLVNIKNALWLKPLGMNNESGGSILWT